MISREAVNEVLQKHGIVELDDFPHPLIPPTGGNRFPVQHLIADLLALPPPPSREALEKILSSYECHIKGGGTTAHFFREELMAWASGQPERRCKECGQEIR